MSGYQPLPQSPPTNDNPSSPRSSTSTTRAHDRPLRSAIQAEFDRPPPSWWKRALLILGLAFMGWLSWRLGSMGRGGEQKVIYATRYSDEFKYRPAASPVITEHLKDGRIRLRGASIGGIGVREEDIPLTPAQIKARDEQRRKEAREKAKERLGLVGKKRGKGAKGKGKGKGEGRVEI